MLSIGSFDAFRCKKKQGHCPAPHHHPWHPVTAVEMAGVLLAFCETRMECVELYFTDHEQFHFQTGYKNVGFM